jgi:hypothetical protein
LINFSLNQESTKKNRKKISVTCFWLLFKFSTNKPQLKSVAEPTLARARWTPESGRCSCTADTTCAGHWPRSWRTPAGSRHGRSASKYNLLKIKKKHKNLFLFFLDFFIFLKNEFYFLFGSFLNFFHNILFNLNINILFWLETGKFEKLGNFFMTGNLKSRDSGLLLNFYYDPDF